MIKSELLDPPGHQQGETQDQVWGEQKEPARNENSLPLLAELEWVSLQNRKTGEREGNLAGISPLAGTPGMILVVIADPQMLHRGFFSLTTVEKWNWIEFEFDSCLGHSPPGLSLVKCAEEVAPATAAMVVLVVVCCRWWGKVERAGRTS